MPYLDAALAFALTMLAVATLVTQLVRFGQHLAGLRTRVLNQMLVQYFSTELKPVLERELKRLQNQITSQVAGDVLSLAGRLDVSLAFSSQELKTLTEVSAEEIVERLKRSSMGLKLLGELGDQAENIFKELARRYEIVGEQFTQSFRTHSRLWATGVALVLAFALNIDSLFIADTYIKNQGMREAVIAQKDSLQQGYQDLANKLEQEQGRTEISKQEFEQAFADAHAQMDIFTISGFPIGASYFPFSCGKNPESSDCKSRNTPLGITLWLLGCILTSLLAGLGGPFWYDVVSGVSYAIQQVRNPKKVKTP